MEDQRDAVTEHLVLRVRRTKLVAGGHDPGGRDNEGAAGGYLFDTYELEGGYSCLRKPFEVVDNKGEVIGRFWSSDDAKQFAKEKGLSTDWITLEQLQKLRETGSIS